MRIFLVLLVYIDVLLFAAIARGYSTDKRLQNPSGFNTMMRYGRSSTRSGDKRPPMYSRADRAENFFLGPRYGKRSTTTWSPSESLVYPVPGSLCGNFEDLTCTWTGVSNLYKCVLK